MFLMISKKNLSGFDSRWSDWATDAFGTNIFFLSHRRDEGEMILIRALNCSQGQRYLELAEKRQANESFIYGWIKERVRL